MTMILYAVLIAAVLVIAASVWTRLSVHRSEKEKAYWAGIRQAETEYYLHVYGKYLNANA